jgi:hypothetical protein
MVAALGISDEAAKWMSLELGLVAAGGHGYFSMTEEASFPLPLEPMERLVANDCGFA